MIVIQDVKKYFSSKENEVHAVNGVSLTIDRGQIYGIIGYSGAGKSTLVRLLNGLEKPTSGHIFIDGIDINTLKKKELSKQRQKIGMIFQHFNLLWSRTVQKNIELPLELAGMSKQQRQEKVKRLIELVGLTGKENAYPSELSGGQKQRVGIARALANDPNILLCDEATSALDPETTIQILDLLKDINEKLHLTIVMITHQMEVVQRICHQVAVMSEGKVVEVGDVISIFQHPKHEVTKRFVQNLDSDQTIEQLADELKKMYPHGQLLRISFHSTNTYEPIVMNAARQVHFEISIVEGRITHSASGPIGNMYVHISQGSEEEYNRFVEMLVDAGVKVEVL